MAAALCCAGTASADFLGIKVRGTNPMRDAEAAPKLDASQLAPYARHGYGSIKGHLGTDDSTQNGNEITFPHNDVFLVPAVPYTRWYFMDYLTKDLRHVGGLFIEGHAPRIEYAPFDATALKYTRKAETDDAGRYQFLGLPTGDYYVIAFVNTVINGSNIRQTFDGSIVSIANYKEELVSLLGDEPPLHIDGDRQAAATALIRIRPNIRVENYCRHDVKLAPCNQIIDLDQFLGGRGDY
jgi:hypothetical protein